MIPLLVLIIILPLVKYSSGAGWNVFPPNSKPYGLSYNEWSTKWWKWLLSVPSDISPIKDDSGKNCGINQNGPVWFLVGTGGGNAERTCNVPSGKAILVTPFNAECSRAEDPAMKTDTDLYSCVKALIDPASDVVVAVDGRPVPNVVNYRIESNVFNVTLPEKNIFGAPPGQTQSASDGYFLILPPLSPGNHEITARGGVIGVATTDTGNVVDQVTYHLIVR